MQGFGVFDRVTLKLFFLIVGVYFLLWLPAYFWSGYLDTPFGLIAAIPLVSIYFFHSVGIPGLLKNGGSCGWGWCAPTVFGWIFLVIFWLAVAWVLARVMSGLRNHSKGL
jgi:hypothetical protein